MRTRKLWPSLVVVGVLFILPLVLFWPVTIGPRTLLPVDNLFAVEPWRSFASQLGVGAPHNELLSDLILENYVWKRFIRDSIAEGQLPLWNPYLFGGLPFLAAGQHSALYPLSVIFYILPLSKAYGWFTVIQLFLAGLFTYFFGRSIRLNRFGSLMAAVTYMFSSFFLASVVFPMVIAAAAWLPLVLTAIETMVRKQEEKGPAAYSPVPYVLLGSAALGLQLLAGHVEITYYVLLVAGFYADWRLIGLWRSQQTAEPALKLAGWLLLMVVLGIGLGAVLFIPLFEVAGQSFRQGSARYSEVVEWAYPWRQLATFLVPNFFGNPSHHSYWDVVSRTWLPVARNALGQPILTIEWLKELPTWKNYVEGAAYVGVLPLALSAAAILGRRSRYVWLFGLLAILSLLFAFGTPLYALLYYLLPGYNQLHSPFRWVFPYTLSVAVLCGIGATYLSGHGRQTTSAQSPVIGRQTSRRLAWPLFWIGMAGAVALGIVLAIPGPFVALSDRVLARSELTQRAFDSGRMLLSYQWRNLLILFLLLAASGAVIRVSRGALYLPREFHGYGVWKPLAVLVLALDLALAAGSFNPAADPQLLDFTPPVAEFLRGDTGLWRFTSFAAPGEKTFTANAGMLWNFQDVRGYDSIFSRQYADFMGCIEEQDELLYNRIAPLSEYKSLDSPLLDLLNVKYVVTTQHVPNPGWKLVHESNVRVYENVDVMPRAFALPRARAVSPVDLHASLTALDPRRELLIDAPGQEADSVPISGGDWPLQRATVTNYGLNDVTVEADMPGEGYLVLADSYAPGWKAYRRAPDTNPKDDEEVALLRADGNFRAVRLEAGRHIVHFKYTPMSAKVGLYVSFMSAVILFLLGVWWAWGRYYRESDSDPAVKRVAKNSLTPMALSLLNKVIDMAFAMLMLRILAPENAGRYQFAVAFFTFFEILVRFGFGTLLTREVSRDHEQANRYLSNTIIVRTGLWGLSLPIMAVIVALYMRYGGVTPDTALAIGLLAIALWFSVVSDALASVFYAYEKMEHPAALSTATSIMRVLLGTLVLLPPLSLGFVGLAGVAVLTNVFTMGILYSLLRRHFFRPRLEWDRPLVSRMFVDSFPLMVNHLLQTIFFRIDVWILQPMHGAAVVGYYGAAYKYVDGINVVPSLFTIAIFPLLSRFATQARSSVLKTYVLALRLLLMLAIPIAVITPFISRELILILGGGDYLPDSAIALQFLIAYFPFSCINQVTQYVLIAIDQQRYLTRAFLVGVGFNVVLNLIFIPAYSYRAAAIITALSELALLVPFYYCVHKNLGPVPWLSILWRPALSSAGIAVVMLSLSSFSPLVTVPLAGAVYLAGLLATGAFRDEGIALVLAALPIRPFRPRPPVVGK